MSKTIAKAGMIWGASIALSRVIGLVREAVIGRTLGAGPDADAYWSAFVVPDFLNYLLAGGALSIVFIPIFAAYLARGEETKGWRAFSAIASFLVVALGVLTVFLWVGMPQVVELVAPGFDDAQKARLVELSRILLPAQLFHVIGGLLAAALQARDQHKEAALAPLVYNGGIIAGGLVLGGTLGAAGFAWGVLAGSFLGPFLLPWLACRKHGMRWTFGLDLKHADLRTYLARSLPIMIGFSIVVVDDWFLRREGSKLGTGAVTTLTYAKNLMKVPMGVFGLAAGVAAYPTLARLATEGKFLDLRDTLIRTLRHLVLLAFAAQAVLSTAGQPIAAALYGRRVLAERDVREIATCLFLVSLGLVAWSAQTVIARGFYALGNTTLPAVLGTVVAVVAFPAYFFAGSLGGTHGLALVSSLAILVYVALLGWKLAHELPALDRERWIELRTFGAKSVVALAVGWALGTVFGLAFTPPGTFTSAVLQTIVLGGITFAGFALAAHFLHIPEIAVWKERVVARFGTRAADSAA